jgi:hypothetical protein
MMQVSPSTQATGNVKCGASVAKLLPQLNKNAAHIKAKGFFMNATVNHRVPKVEQKMT